LRHLPFGIEKTSIENLAKAIILHHKDWTGVWRRKTGELLRVALARIDVNASRSLPRIFLKRQRIAEARRAPHREPGTRALDPVLLEKRGRKYLSSSFRAHL